MSALAQLARLGIKYSYLPRLASKQTLATQRLMSDSVKQTVLNRVKQEEQKEQEEPWSSYGFSDDSKIEDRHIAHLAFFGSVTILLVTGGVFWAYGPDTDLKNWSQREAFLQLRYREEHGLPRIDPNYINPAKINLPSDEELGDTEIII